MDYPKVPISIGELIDKITILQIKSEKTDNDFVRKELEDLVKIANDLGVYKSEYVDRLKEINLKLWVIEDRIREMEKMWKFNDEFIDLARQVYFNNDKRAQIKKEINQQTNSKYQEVKIYK